MNILTSLLKKHNLLYKPTNQEIQGLINELPNWNIIENGAIACEFRFKEYKNTVFFVNAIAFIAEKNNHHPDITFGYNYCNIEYITHDVGGLSLKDFICAKYINDLSDLDKLNH